MSISPAAAGAALGASLIIAIGAQNAFVLRQGLRRAHVLPVVAVCASIDVILIALGVGGFGTLIARFPALTTIAAWAGALFLIGYGAMSFRSALRPSVLDDAANRGDVQQQLVPVVLAALAVSLLNPHVYLDTVVLLGGVAAQYPAEERASFAAGAATASVVWFSSLGFGARLLAPLFSRPSAWRVLDAVVGAIMWAIAISLIVGVVGAS